MQIFKDKKKNFRSKHKLLFLISNIFLVLVAIIRALRASTYIIEWLHEVRWI